MRFLSFPAAVGGLIVAAGCATAPEPSLLIAMSKQAQAAPAVAPYSVEEIDPVYAGKGLTDCFWVGTLNPETFNILSPDRAVTYWISQVKLPAGGAS